MNVYSDELRLLWVVLLNGGVFASAYRFARRRGSSGAIQAICDAFLLYFLVQYAAVGLPGVCGQFNAYTMTLVAALAMVAMWIGGGQGEVLPPSPGTPAESKGGGRRRYPAKRPPPLPSAGVPGEGINGWSLDHFGFIVCALFAGGYLGAVVWSQRYFPPCATDPLVYHLPTAVQWIQTHRLGIYPTWYWNPAASYSPGTGSMFMAWWMAPAGNDVFVRFCQLPPLIFIFFLVARMCRVLGCTRTLAGLIAVGATLSRPLLSEEIIPKDDLYVASFIAAGILSLSKTAAGRSINPWRVGVAIGFVLASKYTALLVCPIFLFLIDSPFRSGWRMRQWTIAVGVVLVMACPWYIRNIVLAGNPLYPVDVHLPGLTLHGLFGTERDQDLRSGTGIWHMLADTYHSLPTPLIVALVVGWLGACIAGGRKLLTDPLVRTCVIGSAVTFAIFLATSPHHEVRYLFPLIVLWFVATAVTFGATRIRHSICATLAIAVISTMTSFDWSLREQIAEYATTAVLITGVVAGILVLQTRVLRLSRDGRWLAGTIVTLGIAAAVHVFWQPYVNSYSSSRLAAWSVTYPRQAGIWQWEDEHVPADASLAYANTFFIYPYYGFDLTRRVGYAPVRKGLHDFVHFPRMGDRVPGDLLVQRMTDVMNEDPDAATWLENLRAMHAEYLVVMKPDRENAALSADPPELRFARSDPAMFVPMEDNQSGELFRIVWR